MTLLIGVLGPTGCDWITEECCYAVPMLQTCENNTIVTRDLQGTEQSREACAQDEQCFSFTKERAECRLLERCADPPAAPECRGDRLVHCAPNEAFLSRLDCRDGPGGKQGRCEPATASGARCVDLDARPCQKHACDGSDKLLCEHGYTSRFPACALDSDRAAGGTCRVNHEGRPVCAQPDAPRCDPSSYEGRHCSGTRIVRCREGFIWRHRCPEGTTCHLKQYGDKNPSYHPVCQ